MSARTPIHHLRYYSSKPQIGKKVRNFPTTKNI
jgi:hypothetical protein